MVTPVVPMNYWSSQTIMVTPVVQFMVTPVVPSPLKIPMKVEAMMQLDLFTYRKPATIHAFPLDRRRKLVGDAAEALNTKSYSQGKAHWTRLVSRLWKEMHASGLDTQMIEREIAAFGDAVSREINICQHYRGTDGAA
ncbi:DUF6074 family protein [Phyllobacterium chamaecytisi]|uniref:DUF6074 family protein n=1 Tax=Phyllobacterium chamaecytisi TaxID=2876082 RepID=UPI001CCA1992|nr:DUF6074 family protein [Phyllobacterium sp. KW56]MBZ9603963.1 DUF6074 family protein [Phyllobacterium sp. KW56]